MTDRDDWLERRRLGLTGTDLARVLYGDPMEVFAEKMGHVEDAEPTPEMRLGLKLEPVILSEYEEVTGHTLWIPTQAELPMRHPEHAWVLASIDAEVPGERIVDAKARSFLGNAWGEPGTDEVPPDIVVQVAVYMAVRDLPVADVPVLNALRLRIYTVARSRALEEKLLELGRRFWEDHVIAGEPPVPNHRSRKAIERLYPMAADLDVVAVEEHQAAGVLAALAERDRLKTEAKRIEERLEELDNGLRLMIGSHLGIRAATGDEARKVTWKEQQGAPRFDTKAALRDGALTRDVLRRYERRPTFRRLHVGKTRSP